MKQAGSISLIALLALVAWAWTPVGAMQSPPATATNPAPGQGRGGAPGPAIVSPEVLPDHRITFRILAPQAQNVRLSAGDIPGLGQTGVLSKGENGVWSVTVGPVDPGAYRYNFNVDGVAVIDPRSPATSESNNNVWSVVYVSGSEWFDSNKVPHGAVAAVTYSSAALGRDRRMHVYTPPGYELGSQKYPVLYLLHGAGDSNDAWTSVGRAAFILDNLIAARKATPMIVVMPAGHTNGPIRGVGGPAPSTPAAAGTPDDFTRDFTGDILPYIETHYRVVKTRQSRAIAGLSMGGSQTLNIAIPNLEQYGYIGVFSSGLLGGGRGRGAAPAAGTEPVQAPPFGAAWEKQNLSMLDNERAKKGLKVFWFSTGSNDGLITTTRSTVELLKKHGFDVQFSESPGGHTWINWRNYLVQFVPLLFK